MAVIPGRNRTTLSTVSAIVVSAPGPGIDRHIIGIKVPNLDTASTADIRLHRVIGGTSRRFDKIDALAVGSVWNPVDREHPLILKSTDELVGFLSAAVSSPPDVHAEYIDKVAGAGISAQPTSAQFNSLSDTVSALRSAHDVLSNRVSANSGAGGAGSVTSTELSAVSAQAASADSVIRTSITAISNLLSGVSAKSVGGSSVKGLQSTLDALSNRISAGGGVASVTSTELSAVSATAAGSIAAISNLLAGLSVKSIGGTSVKGLQSILNAISTKTDGYSNAISALEIRVSTLSNVASNALSVGNAASAAAAALSTTLAGLSVRSVGGTSVKGLQSILNALSNKESVISNTVSALEVRVSAVSNAASNALSVANAASAAAAAISTTLAGLSVKSVGGTSVKGLQSILNTLSNKASVTSNALSALEVRVSAVSNVASNAQSIANAASAAAAALSNTVSALEVRVSAVSNVASNALSVGNAASAAAAAISTTLAGLSVKSVGGTSVKGMQSVLNALSNRISAGGGTASVTSNEFSALEVRVSALCAAPAGVSVTSTELSAALAVSVRNSAFTSVKGLQSALNTLSANIAIADSIANGASSWDAAHSTWHAGISARSVGVSVKGLQSALNAISNTISDAMSVGSASYATVSARIDSVLSAHNALSNIVSAIPGATSTPTVGMVSVANTMCVAALTNISGMSTSVSVGRVYKIEGWITYCCSAATGHAFGLTFPTVTGAGKWAANLSTDPTGLSTFSNLADGSFDDTDTGSAVLSLTAAVAGKKWAKVDAVFAVCATGVVQAQARASVATNAIVVHRGSYIRAIRIG